MTPVASPMTPTAGDIVLDRYRVIARPPPGDAHDTVLLARDERLGHRVDLVVAPAPAGTPAGERLLRRAGIVATLQHPVLPMVLDMGLHDGRAVLVYQHADGRLLADIMPHETARWPDHRAPRLVADLAAALGLAHAHGLSHGALGARSVLVGTDDLVTILDLAWPRSPSASDPLDVAPEVRAGNTPGPRADVYALGQLLRRLEVGQEWDVSVQDVIRRATAREPRDRHADGTALALSIARALSTPRPQPATGRAPYPSATYRRAPMTVVPGAHSRAHPAIPPRAGNALAPLILTGAIGLLPIVGAIAHSELGHFPPAGFSLHGDHDRWRGWPARHGTPPWRDHDGDQSPPPFSWGMTPHENGP